MPKANVNGINIDYRIEGQEEPLIVIAGFSSTKNDQRFQTRSFKKYYHTITFDNRGVGESDKPIGPYTIKMMADDTIGLMDHLGIERSHVLGGSMGGMIAQELAVNYPERVDKLVLACTSAKRDETSGPSSEVAKALEVYEKSSRNEEDIRRLYHIIIDLSFNKRLNRILVLPLAKLKVKLASSSTIQGVGAQLDAVLTHDTADRLRLIKAPTLVITGTEDRVIKPTSSEVIANLVPKAKLVKVEDGSHSFSMEMRSEFNKEVLDFLRN